MARRGIVTVPFLFLLLLLCGVRLIKSDDAPSLSAAEETAQEWQLGNDQFDWQQSEPNSTVKIVGRGVEDVDGRIYFAGYKTYTTQDDTVGDLNMFIACLDVDNVIMWTKELGTNEIDAANFITIVNETLSDNSSSMEQMLYVVGTTWGYLDEGGHALNGFGQFGGRDVVLVKLTLSGEKLWARQFGSTANDFGYGVKLDDTFNTMLLTGGCITDQTDSTVEVDVAEVLETRHSFAVYEQQMMDPRPRRNVRHQQYQFAASFNFNGDLLDFTMDGGVTLTPRRRRINENGLVGEYTVVLNRQPLDDVVVRAEDVQLVDGNGKKRKQLQLLSVNGYQELMFSRSNWNREQVVRVSAVDDYIAEGRHYSVITHSVSSHDPNFNGMETPFLYGRNITMQIDDNDIAGITLTRKHMFVAEGGGNDSYNVVLNSMPWYPVDVVVLPVHPNQTQVRPSVIHFSPEKWNISQIINVFAVDDPISEVEYGGLHSGGQLLHYSVSKDFRYHTRRPTCFDITNCDSNALDDCVLPDISSADFPVQVCDITSDCDFTLGNGACVATVDSRLGAVPVRFGSHSLDPSINENDDAVTTLNYSALRELIVQQKRDPNISHVFNGSDEFVFVPPSPELRGFVLSFLGLLNLDQVEKLFLNSKRTLRAICDGIARLDMLRWGFEEWPNGYVERVLEATFAMFPNFILERHAWNCGASIFYPGSSINVSIWDNDPGVTLSESSLYVSEDSETNQDDKMIGTYTIVLNAPPTANASQPQILQSMCSDVQSDACGFWDNFMQVAENIYDISPSNTINISIAIVGNSRLEITPPVVTFGAEDWFLPQLIQVKAKNNQIAEPDMNYALSHHVEDSLYGYNNDTAFWFQGTFAVATSKRFPEWKTSTEDIGIPYNTIPTLLHSPDHRQVNILVRDNQTPGVQLTVNQPDRKITTQESTDDMEWVGDYVSTMAFSDISLAITSSGSETGLGTGTVLKSILVLAPNTTTFMKFHVPFMHEGDSKLFFSSAALQLYQTPFKIFNISDNEATDTDTSTTDNGLFSKAYRLRITLVHNDWTRDGLTSTEDENKPTPVNFVADPFIEVTAIVEKGRSIDIDVTHLITMVLPTRLSVVSFRVEVLDDSSNSTTSTTQLCSSLFERKLRPKLVIAYQFPNLLQNAIATQSSTSVSTESEELLSASFAIDGKRYMSSFAVTDEETDAWWEVTLPEVKRVGTIAVFVPGLIYSDVVDRNTVYIVLIASLTPFNSSAMPIETAKKLGCPVACPHWHRAAVRKGILLWNLQAGMRALRIYREGIGTLALAQVEAYDSYVSITPTSDGEGIRSRLKTEWLSKKEPDSWRILQTTKQTEDENLATGMTTKQSSTSPDYAWSDLAVDGQRHSVWDSLVIQDDNTLESIEAGSTRTESEMNPWWEVDLGEVKPIKSVVIYPYVGENGCGFCANNSAEDVFPKSARDLYAYSRTDRWLLLDDPFIQEFDIVISNLSLNGSNSVAIMTNKTMSFSCANGVTSIAWNDAFTTGRFVTIRKKGIGVLMLNEVEIYRWNPATFSRYLLVEMYANGDSPLAINSIQVYPPTDFESAGQTIGSSLGFTTPIAYNIHSVSSQYSATGPGSALSLQSVYSSDCYIASTSSYHEWVVLEFEMPMRIGLIEIDTDVQKCGANVAQVTSISIASHGALLDGIRSDEASAALNTELNDDCQIDAMGIVQKTSLTCLSYICPETACHTHQRVVGATNSLIMSDFSSVVMFGKTELLPLSRLPLSQNEHRSLLLRDNPVQLWTFDEQSKRLVTIIHLCDAIADRATNAYAMTTVTQYISLSIDDKKEQTFFSSAVTVQPIMPSFSVEFWLLFEFEPITSTDTSMSIVHLYVKAASASSVLAEIGHSSIAFFFMLRDPSSGMTCTATLDENSQVPGSQTWIHVVASYDQSTSSIAFSLRFTPLETSVVVEASAKVSCNLNILYVSNKFLQFGAFEAERKTGLVGSITNVAWYVHALSSAEMLDHYHDFLDSVTTATAHGHNSYAMKLMSKPQVPVTIEINAESECYRFNLCNVSVVPSELVFTPEDWMQNKYVRVLATEDELYEGLHSTQIFHSTSSSPVYQLTSFAETLAVNQDQSDDGAMRIRELEAIVAEFDRDLQLKRTLEQPDVLWSRLEDLAEIHWNWSVQYVTMQVVASDWYNESLSVDALTVVLIDNTVPGIELSTGSLIVSEDGKGNDYQMVLLSEPASIVQITLTIDEDCYRECLSAPLCPSQTLAAENQALYLSCGNVDGSGKLCNITISPQVLFFSELNWSIPQTIRVIAIDDFLDEDDLHLTSIKATSTSSDPVYDNMFLPDVIVAVEDNDETDVIYSSKHIMLSEKGGPFSSLGYPTESYYTLSLLTEPWGNVTIAMSNEANHSCYRSCGYHFDNASCGLPRQQSVSSVRLSTNSTREIHQIRLSIPSVNEVQRIVTYADHIDQIFRLQVAGGYVEEVQVITFQFNDVFKLRFKSDQAIASAITYQRTFRIGASDRTTQTVALDGFVAARSVEAALNTLFGGATSVRVTRSLSYNSGTLSWTVTFVRLVDKDAAFPLLSAIPDISFEGTLTVVRATLSAPPSGTFGLKYGDTEYSRVDVPVLVNAVDLERLLHDLDGVYSVSVTFNVLSQGYGFEYLVTFTAVETFFELQVIDNSGIIPAKGASSSMLTLSITERQSPVLINGAFVIEYFNSFNSTNKVNSTDPISWNASVETMMKELSTLNGVGNVSVLRRKLSPEGGMEWTIEFKDNNGNMDPLIVSSLNLTGKNAVVEQQTVRDGESLGGTFSVEMGGLFTKINTITNRAYLMDMPPQNTTELPFDVSATVLQQALFDLNITELADVTRIDSDCDVFAVCNEYTWIISYRNSPGNLPPIRVYGNDTLTGRDVTIQASTIANGTYIRGNFSLTLKLLDPDTKTFYQGTTWNLPVNVSAAGMDEALEALRFVRSNREAEFNPETGYGRGVKFDKGVRVFREGPYHDGGYTWRLEWAIEDYIRFSDLEIWINTTLVTQEIEPFEVPSEFDLDGSPRCSAIPTSRFERDSTDPFGLRGFCVYDIVNVTHQERFLCNYTVENPWIVFTPENWCQPQHVRLSSVDDFIDEKTIENGNVTFSSVTHVVYSDDLIYNSLPLDPVLVEVESDDLAAVFVSESNLEVSEDGVLVAEYYLQLLTEPLYDVKIIVLPWLDGENTQCYRFDLCNLTFPVDEYVFTPQNWDIRQQVVVHATDDDLDEYDTHSTGISHISYSDDLKYHEITIPKISVTVFDNDDSSFHVSKTTLYVTEGGIYDEYEMVLGTEPFAKVTVNIKNIGTVGNFAIATPAQITFTWKNWNVSQVIRVTAFDDFTQDPTDSSSILTHSLSTNDLNYANLKGLETVKVMISDNDVSGIVLSTNAIDVVESNKTIHTYKVRLTSEPWYPVMVRPNATHNCYIRPITGESVCNATILSSNLYFGAKNWSVWQDVTFLAVDDWLMEAPVHEAIITHSTESTDLLYKVSDYSDRGGSISLRITDNDISFVNISFGGDSKRNQLHVAEGGFNDSYVVFLNSEPYEDVILTLRPTLERITNLDDKSIVEAAQIGVIYGSTSSVGSSASIIRELQLVFTPLDWAQLRLLRVFAIDDKIAEDPTQYTTITHEISSADSNYNISNSSTGVVSIQVMVNDKESIPPPIPLSATFDASGSKIDVLFDSSVYHAATMAVSNSYSTAVTSQSSLYIIRFRTFSCSLVFDMAAVKYTLGRTSSCMWINQKQLRMVLGVAATITLNDVLVLNECSVFANQICQSTTVIRARYSSRSYTQASISVQLPVDIVKPNIVLTMPTDVSSCGTWEVDAILSTGSGGRPFTELYWFALPTSLLSLQTQGSVDLLLTRTKALYTSLNNLCTKYSTDWKSGKSNTLLVPSADLSNNADLVLLSTMAQLRSACYLRWIAQSATTVRSFQLQLNSTLLEPGMSYFIGLGLTNAFKQRSIATKTFAVRKLPGPVVYGVGDTNISVTRVGDPVEIQVNSTVSCTEIIGTIVGYRWFASKRAIGGSVTTSVDLNGTNTAKDPRIFRIPRTQLESSTVYTLRVEAYMKYYSGASVGSVTIIINVNSSPLIPAISGGNRGIGDRDLLLLNGALSSDPDVAAVPFKYSWKCEDITDTSASEPQSCANSSASTSTKLVPLDLASFSEVTLSLPPFTLAQNRTLRFSLVVSKTAAVNSVTRTATASTIIWTLQGSLPMVQVQLSAQKINPSSLLHLLANVTSAYPYTGRWIQEQGDLGLSDNEKTSGAFVKSLSSTSNVIPKNKLTAGITYVFRFIATDINNNVGFGTATVEVNSPPSSGILEISPLAGYAMQDQFVFSCSQWTDDADDFPLKYAFGAIPTMSFLEISSIQMNDTSSFISLVRKTAIPLVAEQLTPKATVVMVPPTGFADSENVTIVALITDNLGSVAIAYESIEVYMPPDAKTRPLTFVSDLLDSIQNSDASQQGTYLLAGAQVLQNAFNESSRTGDSNSCPGADANNICSSRGTCDPTTLRCSCEEDFLGSNCEYGASDVRTVNDAILTTLASAFQLVEPTISSLSQQALVLSTVTQASSTAFNEDGLSQVVAMSKSVAQSSLRIQDPSVFLDSIGVSMIESLSTLLSVAPKKASSVFASGSEITTSDTSDTSNSKRRLTESETNRNCDNDAAESTRTKARFKDVLDTLNSLAAISSQDLEADDNASVLVAGQVGVFSASGATLKAQDSSMTINVTDLALACLDSDIFINAFVMTTTTHSTCSLQDAMVVSSSVVFNIHSKEAMEAAISGKTPSIELQALSSSSLCVANVATESAATTQRRLAAYTDESSAVLWHPLVALAIPHNRELSLMEKQHFATDCRTWNAEASTWDADICFKDDSASTSDITVCYCSEIGTIEVLVVLKEKLDFYALTKDLYRNDPASIVPGISMIVLLSLFIVGGKFGARMDVLDLKKMKDKTIQNLSRAKWSELEARTQSTNTLFEDFSTYIKMKKLEAHEKQGESRAGEQTTVATDASTTVSSISLLTGSSHVEQVPIASSVIVVAQIDSQVVLPNETRTLFGTSRQLDRQYTLLTNVFRACNLLLMILGLILVFVGIDFYLVLGNSTSEVLLYVYGKPLGLVLVVFGSILIVSSSFGVVLAQKERSHLARNAYATWLLILLLSQFFFVVMAFQYLEDIENMPSAALKTLQGVWASVSSNVKKEISTTYGCCGFVSISEEEVCPEEALDAVPPRTCFHVLATHAHELFLGSFMYLKVLFAIEVACIAVANLLVKWRYIRLLQLAGEPVSSTNRESSASQAILGSQVNVMLLCTLPSIYALSACLMGLAMLFGLDMILQWNFLSNAVISALFGIEVGSTVLIAALIYLLILLKGIRALAIRDIHGLQWFITLSFAFLVLSCSMFLFFRGVSDNFLLDPAIMELVETKYLLLPRQTLIDIETAMECCGFDVNNQGTCVMSEADESIRTCRVIVQHIVMDGVETLTHRLQMVLVAEIIVLILSIWLFVRVRRFAVKPSVHPVGSRVFTNLLETEEDEFISPTDVLIRNCFFFLLALVTLLTAIVGFVLVLVGVDIILQLNVLHISYLLQSFDRRLGVYVISFGSVLEIYACFGILSASKRSRTLYYVYGLTGLALFIMAFGTLGVSYRFSKISAFTAEYADHRLENLWLQASAETKSFIQNTFTCCGYEKIESQNGTISFTNPAEALGWRQTTLSTTAYAYNSIASSSSSQGSSSLTSAIPQNWTARVLTETKAQVVSHVLCPVLAKEGCSVFMKKYLVRVARYSFRSSIGMLTSLTVTLLSTGILCFRRGRKMHWTKSWKLQLTRVMMLLLVFVSVFVALSTFFLGLDIVAQWSIFSSHLLQLVFEKSIGVMMILGACLVLGVNFYSAYATLYYVVHQLFLQAVERTLFALALWLCVGLTGYLSHYSASNDWKTQLISFLDYKWNTLEAATQHIISLDYQCCGFNDPVVVKGQGIVFDRPALGYTCSLANSRGCRGVLVAEISSSFAWLFQYLLLLALLETMLLCLGIAMLQQVKRIKKEEWFVIESRIRYVVGKYRSEARRKHLLVSIGSMYDPKFTRWQRMTCILCSLMTTFAIYTGYFATKGCYRTSLKTCEQPTVWEILGMAVVYGGAAGYAAQCLCRFFFELVRNRCDEETKEVAVARQRKEKVLLFRSLFQRRRRDASSGPTAKDAQVVEEQFAASSTMETSHSTTEERWYLWFTRFVHWMFQVMGVLLFLVALCIATLMALVLMGYNSTVYEVKLDTGPRELLVLSFLMAGVALSGWLATDMKERKRASSVFVFIMVAVASILVIGAVLVGVYMVNQVLEDSSDSSAIDNWTIRKTGFSVVQRLENAWRRESSGYFRNRIQQDLLCCGFRSASDAAFRPCPPGYTVQVEYEATLVNGTTILKTQDEVRDLVGCLAPMLAHFQQIVDVIGYVALGICISLMLLILSSVFLAYDVVISKDAKLKLRVTEEKKKGGDVRETFEKVVGLKIAAPARGKILAKMVSTSLDHVVPTIATELASSSLVPGEQKGSVAPTVPTATTMASSSTEPLAATKRRPSLATLSALPTNHEQIAQVPYPASIVYMIFAVCAIWVVIMGYLIVKSSMQLGVDTAWTCVLSWCVGILFQVILIEPGVIFGLIVLSTLGTWWETTWIVRLLRYGRAALRIKPDAATAAALYYASLSLYERIRYNAAVRIQRRLLTRVTRQRYLHRIRELRKEQHRQLVEKRRQTLKQAINGFTEEEITAFHIIFQDADTAKLGLVSYTVISQSIYQLGVHVAPPVVQKYLIDLDPAYADLVDFEHFLYGMHCARLHHQEEQSQAALLAQREINNAAGLPVTEEFVSSSARFGPGADPQSKILVKRQNLLRELKEKRESLTHKLMSKVSKLPPILHRGSSRSLQTHTPLLIETPDRGKTSTDSNEEEAAPTGASVILQNRKLSPKKRALEMILKRKHREDSDRASRSRADQGNKAATSPRTKTQQSPKQKARTMISNRSLPSSPRGQEHPNIQNPASYLLETVSIIPIAEGEEEMHNEASIPVKVDANLLDSTQISLIDPPSKRDEEKMNVVDGEARSLATEHEEATVATTTRSDGTVDVDTQDNHGVDAEIAGASHQDDDEPKTFDNKSEEQKQENMEDDYSTGDEKVEEPKPFGTYMLLSKQTPTTGKHKVMEKILEKQMKEKTESKVSAEGSSDEDEIDSKSTHKPPAANGSSRPSSPATKAAAAKQTSLEKALKKNLKQKPMTPKASTPNKRS